MNESESFRDDSALTTSSTCACAVLHATQQAYSHWSKGIQSAISSCSAVAMDGQGPAETRGQEDPAFDPFRRHDQYGQEGAAPQPFLEYLRLAVAAFTILPLKLLGCLTCLIACYCMCKLSFLFPAEKRAAWVATCAKFFVRAELFCLGFVTVQWHPIPDRRQPKLPPDVRPAGIVSNHCSWADILLHMSRSFPSFVARASTKNLPWVGLIRYMPMEASLQFLPVCAELQHITAAVLLQSTHGLPIRGA